MARPRKEKFVIGRKTCELFDVFEGRECRVLDHYFMNGESWYTLKDIQTNEKFDSPAVFWKEKV